MIDGVINSDLLRRPSPISLEMLLAPLGAAPADPAASLLPRLYACRTARELHQLHGHAAKSGAVYHPRVAARLLFLYSSRDCVSHHLARSLFALIPSPDLFCWNILARCLVAASRHDDALVLFRRFLVLSGAPPDEFTFPFVIKACSHLCAAPEGRQIHGLAVRSGFASNRFVQASLISFYAKCGEIASARKVFDGMLQREIVVWNSMLHGYVRRGDIASARNLFDEMPEKDVFSWTTLVTGYATCRWVAHARAVFDRMPEKTIVAYNAMLCAYVKCGDLESARRMFETMPERNVVSWNLMVNGYEKNGFFTEALEVFESMVRLGRVPNYVTLVGALNAAAGLAILEKGLFVHRYIKEKRVEVGGLIGTCLIDMYAKCGNIGSAVRVFRNLPSPNLGHWTAILVGLGMHGKNILAMRFFNKMLKIGLKLQPTMFSGVLNACSHVGMVDEGRQVFELMKKYQIEPALEHYVCIVDLLCRVGSLEEAKNVIEGMPMKPNETIWMSLLSGCRKHGNIKIGEYAAQRVFELAPNSTGCYILLSSIYAASNDREKVAMVREIMNQRGIRKDPGQSLVEHNGAVHCFVANDRSHPQTEIIYDKLLEMGERLKDAGYVPDTTQALFCFDEVDKEAELVHHSERLAIAFSLINSEAGKPIRIMGNLRICNDCHNVAKLLSAIYGCRIIVRNDARFHHFHNGSCSCRDYW